MLVSCTDMHFKLFENIFSVERVYNTVVSKNCPVVGVLTVKPTDREISGMTRDYASYSLA